MLDRELSGPRDYQVSAPANGATDASAFHAAWSAPYNCVVKSISYVALTSIAGQATNYVTRSVYLKDGTTAIATLAFSTAPVASSPSAPVTIPLTGTAAQLKLAKGDSLLFKNIKTGTGLALPAGQYVIEVQGDHA